jgi:hypothetical protein
VLCCRDVSLSSTKQLSTHNGVPEQQQEARFSIVRRLN